MYNILVDSDTLESSLNKYSKENNVLEKTIRDRLALELNGQVEVRVNTGYIDILTSTELIEIKQANDWKGAIGQLMAYSRDYPDRQKRLHLFGSIAKGSFDKILKMCNENNIKLTYEAINY